MNSSTPSLAASEGILAFPPGGTNYSPEEERQALLFLLEDLERTRRQIEQAHHEWVAAVDAISDPIFMRGKDNRILRSNRAYAERAGMTVQEVLGKFYWEAFPKLDGPLQESETGTEIQIASGETFILRTFPVPDSNGNPLYSLHVMEDITERKRMQQALQENEERFRQICSAAQDAIVMMDATGLATYWNKAAEKIFGYTAEEALGKNLNTLIVPERFRKAFTEKFLSFAATGSGVAIGTTLELKALGKNRDEFPVELSVSSVKLGGKWHAVGIVRDITERKKLEESLRHNEEMLRQMVSSVKDYALIMLDTDGRVANWNEGAMRIKGYQPDEIIGQHFSRFYPSEDIEQGKPGRLLQEAVANGRVEDEGWRVRKDGSRFMANVVITPIYDRAGLLHGFTKIVRDITERKHAETLLHESKERYRRITDGLTDYLYTVRVENGLVVQTTQSETCENVTGYTAAEFAANPNLWIQMVVPMDRELVLGRVRQVLAGSDVPPLEHRIIRKDGALRWIHNTIILFKDATGKLLSYDGVISDITDRKRHEELTAALLNIYTASESIDMKTALQQGLDTIQYLTGSKIGFLHFVNENQDEIELATWSSDTLKHYCNAAYDNHYPVSAAGIWADCIRSRRPIIINDYATTSGKRGLPQGHAPLQRFVSAPIMEGVKVRMVIGVGNAAKHYNERDAEIVNLYGYTLYRIVQRKRAEQAILHANRALKTLSAGNTTLIKATEEQQLLQDMCRVAVDNGGYRMAWVGYKQNDADKSVRLMAYYGLGSDYAENLRVSWSEDSVFGHGPTGKALRNGELQIAENIQTNPDFAPWREQAIQHGFASSIALPLLSDGEAFGAMNIYAVEPNAFDEEEVRLLHEMASDLAYGIQVMRLRKEQQHSAEQVRKGLEGTVQMIAAIVEMRDPYTAGHQRRVAQLSAAIAAELGLPDEQVRGIHLAGTIHDLGKIQTPAEILSKPGKLSNIEFSLIKGHAQNGYEILKGIEFPWPIAQIVWQHHEKLDGSGYPQGLKGEEILPEARILSVADIVEAMSSHRPYRPGLGIEAALKAINDGRKTLYDAAVVDACTRLFREKGFILGAV